MYTLLQRNCVHHCLFLSLIACSSYSFVTVWRVIVASGTVMSYDLPLCHFHKTAKTGTRARQGGPQTFLVLYLAFSFQAVTHITDVPQGAEFTVSIEANFQFYTGGVLDNPECDAQLMALVRDQPWRDGGLHEQCGGGLRRLDTVCAANVMRVGTLPLYKPFTSFIYLLR
jgi:hypothetical protein